MLQKKLKELLENYNFINKKTGETISVEDFSKEMLEAFSEVEKSYQNTMMHYLKVVGHLVAAQGGKATVHKKHLESLPKYFNIARGVGDVNKDLITYKLNEIKLKKTN